ncbi:hypothetical protein GYMLUDRAFT_236879 [Collybiopsis luxurians FD-317 M1]|nr:hypothetical protein GYMLUDRAFT_236879 [Collybiopsis luxurians FD-317 M1]
MNEAFAHLRRESLDIFNRLKSIQEDINFVNQVHYHYPEFPLLPNLRCGAWYTDPSLAAPHPVYFKSTDGHFLNWNFNLRRPNLHLLNAQYKGIVLVDSTRSGKRMPDALSKTVPIWCSVINRAILLRYPEKPRDQWDVELYTPPGVISTHEHSQILLLLDGWARSLHESSYSLPNLEKPLRPIWITPSSTSFPKFPPTETLFIPVICVSASRQVEEGSDRRSGGFVYIQGSGDDHESWGMGLNPAIFWQNRERIFSADRSEMERVVASAVSSSQTETSAHRPSAVGRVDGRILLCSTADLTSSSGKLLTMIGEDSTDVAFIVISCREQEKFRDKLRSLFFVTSEGKKGQAHFLQTLLPRSMEFIQKYLAQGMHVCIACDTGKDLSVGVATAALQKFFDDNGNFSETELHVPGEFRASMIGSCHYQVQTNGLSR